jgi:hypothetical protein
MKNIKFFIIKLAYRMVTQSRFESNRNHNAVITLEEIVYKGFFKVYWVLDSFFFRNTRNRSEARPDVHQSASPIITELGNKISYPYPLIRMQSCDRNIFNITIGKTSF